MGEIFKSGNYFMFFYNCPITNKRKKKQVSISAKVSEKSAREKAEKLQKSLMQFMDSGFYSADDMPFENSLNALAKIYKKKWELHQVDQTTGIRERTYDEYLFFLDVIKGDSSHKLRINGKRIADIKCSEMTPKVANEISKLFVAKLNKNLNSKCWAKFDTACKLAITEGMGMRVDPTLTIKRELHQSKQRVVKKKAPTKNEVDSFLDHLEQRKNKGSNSCYRKDFTCKFDYIYNLYLAHTGKRNCEVLATNINDVDIHKGVVDVNKSLCAKTGNIEMTKTDKSERLVALTDKLTKGIQEWVAYLVNKEIPNPKRLLFPSMNGNYKNSSNVLNRSIKKNVKEFGLDSSMFSPHQYRRHNNSRRKEAGHNKDRLKNQLGHEDEKMSNLYNTTWEDVKKDRQDINQAFSS